jgi:hypothetical protein
MSLVHAQSHQLSKWMGRSINAGTGKLAVAIKNAELQQKCRKFLLRTPISMTLDSAKSLSRGLVIPSKKNKLWYYQMYVLCEGFSHISTWCLFSLNTWNLSNYSCCLLLDSTPYLYSIWKRYVYFNHLSFHVISYYLLTWVQPSLSHSFWPIERIDISPREGVWIDISEKNKTCSGLRD